MKQMKKTHWLRNTLLILLACGIVGLVLSAVLFFGKPSPTYASATLVFTFDGATTGIAPNGTAFDLRDILRDEVLSQGLKNASMDGRYTPEQIRPSLVARGVYPEDMAEQIMHYESLLNFTASRELTIGDYHPTTFNIALYNDFDKSIPKTDLMALLQGIMDAYRTYFSQVYAYNLDTDLTLFSLDEYDYPQQLQILEERLTTVSSYAQELYEKEPAFRWNGKGFNDISVQLNTLIDSNITRLDADLTINALTKNPERLLTQYQFELRNLNNQLDKQNIALAKLDKLIASYEKNEVLYLSTSESLTKIDGNSSETYDILMTRRKSLANDITNINYQINLYQLRLSDLLGESDDVTGKSMPSVDATVESAAEGGEGQNDIVDSVSVPVITISEEDLAAAKRKRETRQVQLEAAIHSLVTESDAILAEFKAMLQAYSSQKINELTVTVTKYVYKAPALLSGAFIKKVIMTAGPIMAIGFMVSMALIARSRNKEEKRLNKTRHS